MAGRLGQRLPVRVNQAAPLPLLVAAVVLGGAAGGLLRWWLGILAPISTGFPWTTFAINVGGSFALAVLPAAAEVRRRPVLVAGLGPGVLGGFTTLSTYSEETRALLAGGQVLLAVAYLLATLVSCLVVVALAQRLAAR